MTSDKRAALIRRLSEMFATMTKRYKNHKRLNRESLPGFAFDEADLESVRDAAAELKRLGAIEKRAKAIADQTLVHKLILNRFWTVDGTDARKTAMFILEGGDDAK